MEDANVNLQVEFILELVDVVGIKLNVLLRLPRLQVRLKSADTKNLLQYYFLIIGTVKSANKELIWTTKISFLKPEFLVNVY